MLVVIGIAARLSSAFWQITLIDPGIGSGIGLENLQRRLELLYPDAFDYDTVNDGRVYSATVRLKDILS